MREYKAGTTLKLVNIEKLALHSHRKPQVGDIFIFDEEVTQGFYNVTDALTGATEICFDYRFVSVSPLEALAAQI